MPIFDGILILLLAGFVLYGLRFGFVHSFGTLVGVLLGAFIAGRMFEPLAQWGHQYLHGSLNIERIVAFFLIFALVNRLVGIGFSVFDEMFKVLSFLPFLKMFDHLLGGVFGLLEGSLVLGMTLEMARHFPIFGLKNLIDASSVAAWLLAAAAVLWPLIPAAIRAVNEHIGSEP